MTTQTCYLDASGILVSVIWIVPPVFCLLKSWISNNSFCQFPTKTKNKKFAHQIFSVVVNAVKDKQTGCCVFETWKNEPNLKDCKMEMNYSHLQCYKIQNPTLRKLVTFENQTFRLVQILKGMSVLKGSDIEVSQPIPVLYINFILETVQTNEPFKIRNF